MIRVPPGSGMVDPYYGIAVARIALEHGTIIDSARG
jgi:hypothetical protein